MKLKVVVVDLELSPSFKKWCVRLGIPAAILLCAGTVAWAAGLHTWTAGDTLTAADLNGNFSELDSRITALEARSHTPSGFRAELTNTTTIPNATITPVVFNSVNYDLNSEYNATNGQFTVKEAGTYLVQCEVTFNSTNTGGVATTIPYKNGNTELGGDDVANSTSNLVNPTSSTVAKLAVGDVVSCSAYESFGSAQSINLSFVHRDFFAVTRVY